MALKYIIKKISGVRILTHYQSPQLEIPTVGEDSTFHNGWNSDHDEKWLKNK